MTANIVRHQHYRDEDFGRSQRPKFTPPQQWPGDAMDHFVSMRGEDALARLMAKRAKDKRADPSPRKAGHIGNNEKRKEMHRRCCAKLFSAIPETGDYACDIGLRMGISAQSARNYANELARLGMVNIEYVGRYKKLFVRKEV